MEKENNVNYFSFCRVGNKKQIKKKEKIDEERCNRKISRRNSRD